MPPMRALASELRIAHSGLDSKPSVRVEALLVEIAFVPQSERDPPPMACSRIGQAPGSHPRVAESGLDSKPTVHEALLVRLLSEPEPFDSAIALQTQP